MPRFPGHSQVIHQPQFDTFVRQIGVSNLSNNTTLFGSMNSGQKALTNLQVPGQLASDQYYMLKSVRAVLAFLSLYDAAFTAAATYNSSLTSLAHVTGDNERAQDLYMLCAYGCYFTLIIGTKPYLTCPLWYAPQGGGIFGTGTGSNRHFAGNGVPQQTAILKLAKDIAIEPRQAFGIQLDWFAFKRDAQGLGADGSAIGADVDSLAYLNAFDGIKLLQMHIDGILTRDVE